MAEKMKKFDLSHWAVSGISNTKVNFIDLYIGFIKHNTRYFWNSNEWYYSEDDEILYKDGHFIGPVIHKEFIKFLNKFGVK